MSNSTLSVLPLQEEEFKTIDEDQPTAPSAPMENQMTKETVIIIFFFYYIALSFEGYTSFTVIYIFFYDSLEVVEKAADK